jgi:hypothetical protein
MDRLGYDFEYDLEHEYEYGDQDGVAGPGLLRSYRDSSKERGVHAI